MAREMTKKTKRFSLEESDAIEENERILESGSQPEGFRLLFFKGIGICELLAECVVLFYEIEIAEKTKTV